MSQIVVEIPIEALSKPNVARALSELTLALGGHAMPAAAPAAPKVVAVEAYTAAAKAEEPVVKKGRGGRPRKNPLAAPEYKAAAAKPEPAAAPAAPVEEKKKGKGGRPRKVQPVVQAAPAAPAASAGGSAASEKWKKYMANLPENSRRFLELLERSGQLTVNEAVEKLNLPGPKAMGGLTGAMARWAPKQGVQIPYEAREDANGVRYWVWKGIR